MMEMVAMELEMPRGTPSHATPTSRELLEIGQCGMREKEEHGEELMETSSRMRLEEAWKTSVRREMGRRREDGFEAMGSRRGK